MVVKVCEIFGVERFEFFGEGHFGMRWRGGENVYGKILGRGGEEGRNHFEIGKRRERRIIIS